MIKPLSILLPLAFYCFTIQASITNVEIQSLLKKTDMARGGGIDGIVWDIQVDNIEQGKSTSAFNVHVKVKNHEQNVMALVEFLSPPKYRKQKFLMKNYSMWFAKPGLRRPVPISIRQRLSGNASNADIVAANYANDYDATFLRMEKFNGEDCYVFDLVANKSLVSYYRIVYWVSKESQLARKAEFFGKSGKPLKAAYFSYDNQLVLGESNIDFVSEVKIVDHLDKSNITLLKLSNVEKLELNSNSFQANALME